jgi:H+/citrate symporter
MVLVILALCCIRAGAGYTHYYTWKQPPDDTSLKACVADMNRLIEVRKSILVSPDLPESTPGSLKLSATNVDFNGVGDKAHEPFVFPYAVSDHDSFNFCKTAWKPYDEVVTACLIVARDHFSPSVLEIDSDGSWADWSRGAKLYTSVFARPARNPMTSNGLAAVSPKNFWFNVLVSVVVILAILLGFFIWQKRANSYGKAWRRSFQ